MAALLAPYPRPIAEICMHTDSSLSSLILPSVQKTGGVKSSMIGNARSWNERLEDDADWFDESQEINEDNNMEEVICFYHVTVDGIIYMTNLFHLMVNLRFIFLVLY